MRQWIQLAIINNMSALINIISRIYNEDIESFCTRLLYFFNTINTYSFTAGILSFIIVTNGLVNLTAFIVALGLTWITCRVADFFPVFILITMPILIGIGLITGIEGRVVLNLLKVNIIIFLVVQFLFMGIPDSIVARDPKVSLIKIFNSLFTIAPTTVSFSISIFFSFYVSYSAVLSQRYILNSNIFWLILTSILLSLSALITRLFLPKNKFSKFHKPDIPHTPMFKRVVVLNIDGARKDIFDSLDMPAIKKLRDNGADHVKGLETVYRALTNPAFASILTGTIPKVHGIRDNNLGQSIQTEGLADIVPTILYGSMHVKHFSKKYWKTKIISLPRHSIYKSDNIMVKWLKEDIERETEVRLFIADFSEADFLAHAYGSKSRQYKEALKRIDKRIGDIIEWLSNKGLQRETCIIVCSDHGIAAIDHSYLIASAERFVPFIMFGNGIKQGYKINGSGKIMDICSTVAYLLGIRYPIDARGKVFVEAIEGIDAAKEQKDLSNRFNRIKYDVEASDYNSHTEIIQGDKYWWDQCCTKYFLNLQTFPRILDIGCGNGFVASRFIANNIPFKEFVCVDISNEMLKEAKRNLGSTNIVYIDDLDKLEGKFDIITASSIFHHSADTLKMAEIICSLLSDGGIIIGSHEPNRKAFQGFLFRITASLYKQLGGGISISKAVVERFNQLLSERYPNAPQVCREEILQITEYHSPLEQYDRGIDLTAGFYINEFLASHFPNFEIIETDTYTTFYHRNWLNNHKIIQNAMRSAYNILFREGNLFRFVLREPCMKGVRY